MASPWRLVEDDGGGDDDGRSGCFAQHMLNAVSDGFLYRFSVDLNTMFYLHQFNAYCDKLSLYCQFLSKTHLSYYLRVCCHTKMSPWQC